MDIPIFKSFGRDAEEIISKGGLGIIPTDTIYGAVCDAMNPDSVERLYKVCERDLDKPFIITISGFADLNKFKISLSKSEKESLKRYWPGEVSVVFDCAFDEFKYLHRGHKTIAVRFPKKPEFVNFMKKTGPLIATSANPQGEPHADSVSGAVKYFFDKVDFYVDGGEILAKSSTLVRLKGCKIEVLREGSVKIETK